MWMIEREAISEAEKRDVYRCEMMQQFLDAHPGDIVALPLSLLNTTITDDFTSPHIKGPIDVYALRKTATEKEKTGEIKLWIQDGNHRYYESYRTALMAAQKEGNTFDEENVKDQTMVQVRKVISSSTHESDIRHMWNARGWEDVL